MANGSPKPAFFVSVLVVVLALVGLGLWRFGALPGTPDVALRAARHNTKQAMTPIKIEKIIESKLTTVKSNGPTNSLLRQCVRW